MPALQNISVLPQPAFSTADHPPLKNFCWLQEFSHLFSYKFFNILWWPLFKIQQRYITCSPLMRSCRVLPGFSNLWKTIQKGSFAYNTLFLGTSPVHQSSAVTDLADITTIALFFGDEFIDGICNTAGKQYVKDTMGRQHEEFYMKVIADDTNISIEYSFDLTAQLPLQVMNTINPKYSITYSRFYELLQSFLQLMNIHLAKIKPLRRRQVANKIADVCNNCFDSYLNDVSGSPIQDRESMPCASDFHEIKTRHMQKKLLELRCLLAGKPHLTKGAEMEGWLDIMSVVQVYDDMQDVIDDDGRQDNLVLIMARHCFPLEYKWFLDNKKLLEETGNYAYTLSLNMPCTIYNCLDIAVNKIKNMSWEQQKIMHYLLFRNWFIGVNDSKANISLSDDLLHIYSKVKNAMSHVEDDQVKAYVISTCFHKSAIRKNLLSSTNFTNAYQLRYNLLSVNTATKAEIFDELTA